ncbi:MAG: hypothetical protein ACMZI0_13690 [Symbiopectobacterium sp.]|uniref:hypothetical protein n=1 Tax=Symbiopectobacterium sp. TaxID=2952789 RepID=UPI0039E9397B
MRDCNAGGNSQLPVVNITGTGVTQDGKWLFRSPVSTASNVGVMLVKTNVPPPTVILRLKMVMTFPWQIVGKRLSIKILRSMPD